MRTLAEYLTATYVPAHLGISGGYIEQLTVVVQLLDAWHGQPTRLSSLSDTLLQRFLAHLLRTRSAATVNSKRRMLLTLWRAAHGDGLVPELPRHVPKLKERRTLPEAWTVAEIERILAVARMQRGCICDGCGVERRYWWPSLLLMLYTTGVRVGASLQIRPADISLSDRYLVLRAEVQKDARPKFCRLSDQSVAAIASVYDPSRDRVWPWPFTEQYLYRSFKRILRQAGVRYGRGRGGLFHKLRRTSGSLIEANGGDGSRHLGNTRGVFERHYCDPRVIGDGQLDRLPRPTFRLSEWRQLRLF
jgi:integrase